MITPAPEYAMALRALAALAATLGLLLTLAWVWRTYGGRWGLPSAPAEKKRRLRVLESQRLNTHTTLFLVEDGEAEHLLAATAAQTVVIRTRARKPTPQKPAKVGA